MKFIDKQNKWSHDFTNPLNKYRIQRIVRCKICAVCLKRIPKDKTSLTLHHIDYFADGGLTVPENLCWLHEKCHRTLHNSDWNQKKKNEWRKRLLNLKQQGRI